MAKPFLFLGVALMTLTAPLQAQTNESPVRLHDGLLKVSLTDFIAGKYSLSYEHVFGTWASAELTVTGIGMTANNSTYTIAQPLVDPFSSFYPSNLVLPADFETELSGWEVTGAVRKYGWVDDGVPDGFYASAFLMVGGATINADERLRPVAFDPDTVEWEAGAYLDEIDHRLEVKKWGFGLTVGYQWLTESGLGIDAFMGPMFRGMNRTYVMDGLTNDEARDIVRTRIERRYWLSPGAAEHYNGNTGPWFTGGIRVSLAF